MNSLSHSDGTQKGELQEPAIGTLIHSCWIKIQRPDLGQYSIGTVGQYSVGANSLVSLALGSNAPGREIEGPMAIVILGGLLTSTALNLLILPSLALCYGRLEMNKFRPWQEPYPNNCKIYVKSSCVICKIGLTYALRNTIRIVLSDNVRFLTI